VHDLELSLAKSSVGAATLSARSGVESSKELRKHTGGALNPHFASDSKYSLIALRTDQRGLKLAELLISAAGKLS
jgi:hypothetical protein